MFQNTFYTYTINPDGLTITITGYSGPGGIVSIPSNIGKYKVTNIAPFAFSNNPTITNVIIPKTIKNVADFSFSSNSNLQGVDITSQNTPNIAPSAFIGDSSLNSFIVGGLNDYKYIPTPAVSPSPPQPSLIATWDQMLSVTWDHLTTATWDNLHS